MRPLTIACAVLFLACSTDPTIPSGPATIEAMGTLTGTPGWQLEEPLAVLVKNAAGHPVEGATVTWSSSEQGAWLEGETSETDAAGIARMRFAPGWRSGQQAASASIPGFSIPLSISATSLALTMTAAGFSPSVGRRYCGIDAARALWCWLHQPMVEVRASPPMLHEGVFPVRVDPENRYLELLGDDLLVSAPMCGLTEEAELRCWSPADLSPGIVVSPRALHGLARSLWPEVALCGLDTEGQAWCRGNNFHGQLGDGTTNSRESFAPVLGSVRFRSLAGGSASFCGLDVSDRAWCWGRRVFHSDDLLLPTPVQGDHRYFDLGHVFGGWCGLELGTAALRCWGSSGMGSGTSPSGGPFLVPAPTGLVALAGRDDLGIFRQTGGRLLFAGDMAHDILVNRFVRTPEEREGMPTGVAALLSSGGDAWCVAHTSGSTICGSRVKRPTGVPAPR